MDSFAGSSGAAAATVTLSQPRLLIPMILVLLYNRYNLLAADSVGIHLELLPMLLGFFTYKAGVLSQGTVALFRELSASGKPAAPESGDKPTDDLKKQKDAFNTRVLTR